MRFWFRLTLFATLAIKLVLAHALPLSGDEAYFLVWAKHLDFGYYDHPPMVGWILHALLPFSQSTWFLRLPAVLLTTIIGIGIYRLLRPYDEDKAALIGILYLISPISVINVLITTDTPLILFCFLSGAFLFRAVQRDHLGLYGVAGAFLGLAFLSKYFAVLLGLAYFVYFLLSPKNGRRLTGFLILFGAALPFVLVNLYWNYTHCWDNIMFNLYTRNEGEHFSLSKVFTYLGSQVYLMTPALVYYLFKHRKAWGNRLPDPGFRALAFLFLVPMAVFGLLSVKKVIGLHWVLAFYPFLYLLLYAYLTRQELHGAAKFIAFFTLVHLVIIAGIALMPMETWKHTKLYDGIVFMFKTDEIVKELRPYEKEFVMAADGYTPAAIASYHAGRYFIVFGEGSHFARQDDIITDFRQFAGRNILILRKSAPDPVQYAPYFNHVEYRQFTLHGATFYLVLGYGFRYEPYKEKVLEEIKAKYYTLPSFLPRKQCYFLEKYR